MTDAVLRPESLVYADQVAQIATGPFVTRLTFGMAAGSPGVPPDATHSIVLPTPAAHELATQILRLLRDDAAKKTLQAELKAWIQTLDDSK